MNRPCHTCPWLRYTPADAVPLESWDDNISNPNQRFKVLSQFNGAAVLDKNTGLVWEQAPDNGTRDWIAALLHCVKRDVGGTVGWRLPSVVELNSVRNPSLPTPFVPGTVFTGVQSADYWSATTFADTPTAAWYVLFNDGNVGAAGKTNNGIRVWCVRGAMNADAY